MICPFCLSYVVADLSSQSLISHILSRYFPLDPLVGEEDADSLREDAALRARAVELVNETLQEGGLPPLEVDESVVRCY